MREMLDNGNLTQNKRILRIDRNALQLCHQERRESGVQLSELIKDAQRRDVEGSVGARGTERDLLDEAQQQRDRRSGFSCGSVMRELNKQREGVSLKQ